MGGCVAVALTHLLRSCLPSGHNLVKDVTVVETNYTDYALVVKHKVFNREYTQVALYGETGAHTHTHAYTHCRRQTV